MKIVCATSVVLGNEAFSTLGDVERVAERDIDSTIVHNADLLITRSKVKVNRALLENSSVRFAATATAGYDHLDIPFLEESGIVWSSAPGCNANGVAEWVAAALLHLATSRNVELAGKTLGIIGVGHVGTCVAALAPALGLRVLLNDPPRALLEPGPQWSSMETILAESDLLTLHVPLTDEGPHATRAMVNNQFFARMKPGCVFLNASRGEVVEEPALLRALDEKKISHALLDVFAHEPDVNPLLASKAVIVTPHIAGYSYEGRVRGTELCYLAACRWLNVKPSWTPPALPPDPARSLLLSRHGQTRTEALAEAVSAAYRITNDDKALRDGLGTDEAARRKHFQHLRKHYPDRHEFPAYTVRVAPADASIAAALARLGFNIAV